MISKSIIISLLSTRFLIHDATSFTFHHLAGSSSATVRSSFMAWTPNSPEQQSLSEELSIAPLDEYNAALLNEVRPLGYTNPRVEWGTVWDLVVVGAGAGGLVSSRQVNTANKFLGI
jgi:hypothetical protein